MKIKAIAVVVAFVSTVGHLSAEAGSSHDRQNQSRNSNNVPATPRSQGYVKHVSGEHQVSLQDHGSVALKTRLDMIDRAQKSISIESYIFKTDQSGCMILSALVKKARAMKGKNFPIRLMLDRQIFGPNVDAFFVHEMAKEGIEISYYNYAPLIDFAKINHRNHKKTFTIDGGTPNGETIVGGRNIGDDYFDIDDKDNFLDVDVHVQGPAVDVVQDIFDKYWRAPQVTPGFDRPDKPSLAPVRMNPRGGGVDVSARNTSRRQRADWDKSVAEVRECLADSQDKAALRKAVERKADGVPKNSTKVNNVLVASDHPDWKQKDQTLGKEIIKKIEGAKKSVTIENPYLVLIDKPKELVEKKLRDGVKVDVIVNSRLRNPEFGMMSIALYNAKHIAGKGGGAYLYKSEDQRYRVPGVKYEDNANWGSHAKAMLVDGKTSYVGSGNFDPRSLDRINAEIGFFFPDNPEFAKTLEASMKNRMANSTKIDRDGRDSSGVKVETPNYLNIMQFFKIGALNSFKDQL